MALRQRGLAGEVWGLVRRASAGGEAVERGVVDRAEARLEAVLDGADLVVLCTPLGQMRALAERLLGSLHSGALVTDVGSVKGSVVREVEGPVSAAGGRFVGSHPMAGSERSGMGAARGDLFEGAVSVVTPTEHTEAGALREVRALWEGVGAQVWEMSAERHDDLVSRSSHLTYWVSAVLAGHVLSPSQPEGQGRLCASGFRDTTRVAAGSAVMWRDIALANREALLRAMDGYEAEWKRFRAALESGDARLLDACLGEAQRRREAWGLPTGPLGGE
jgi:prephenate dehydrogenase